MGAIQFAKAGSGLLPIRLTGIPFTAAGPYTFSVRFSGQEPLITHFNVNLAQMVPQIGQLPPGLKPM